MGHTLSFVIASQNQGKIGEFNRILSALGISCTGAKLDDVEETGATFTENTLLKARAAFKKTGLPVIADDSGLMVDALGGAPGVYSARYAGPEADSEQNNQKLLKALAGVKNRKARFVCAICCILPGGEEIVLDGVCTGTIAQSPKGENGFGYDCLFICENGRTFGELDDREKDFLSHRGHALRKLYTILSEKDLNQYVKQ